MRPVPDSRNDFLSGPGVHPYQPRPDDTAVINQFRGSAFRAGYSTCSIEYNAATSARLMRLNSIMQGDPISMADCREFIRTGGGLSAHTRSVSRIRDLPGSAPRSRRITATSIRPGSIAKSGTFRKPRTPGRNRTEWVSQAMEKIRNESLMRLAPAVFPGSKSGSATLPPSLAPSCKDAPLTRSPDHRSPPGGGRLVRV